ncbi:MAG: hypothetical protein R3C13_02190 [Hyphomonas sp.]
MEVTFNFDDEFGVDRSTFSPVIVWNRVAESGDYSVQIAAGVDPLIDQSSERLQSQGFQGGGYSWQAMLRQSLRDDGRNPDDGIKWDSEGDVMVTYMKSPELAALVAQHAQSFLTDEDRETVLSSTAKGME